MGNFYTSFTVRNADHEGVVRAMKGRTAAVSAAVDGYTVIWDAECENQDEDLLDRIGQHLSSVLAAPVLAVLNHDDDILLYSLFSPIGKVDTYNSTPGYFEGSGAPPSGGNARILVETISPDARIEVVDRVLRGTEYIFALERHSELLATLGMPGFATSGYNYISQGELPEGLRQTDVTFTG